MYYSDWNLKQHSLKSLKPHWVKAILVFLIFFASQYLYTIINVLIFHNRSFIYSPLSLKIAKIIVILCFVPLFVGCMWYYMELSRGTNPKVTDIFLPYKNTSVALK